jgi:hypothetical protein
MADFSSFTTKFRAQKNGSHESPATKVIKRPRLTCNQCQKSKLRCDRGQPCGSCVKKDEAASCSYQRLPLPVSRIEVSRNVTAEDRLLHLESTVKKFIQSQAVKSGSNGIYAEHVALPEGHDAATKAVDELPGDQTGNTRYVGSTHWSAVLDDIQELKAVLGSSADVQEDEEPTASEFPVLRGELIFGLPNTYSLQQIMSQYLPSRVEVDRLLSTYFQSQVYMAPFIHAYHFQRQYREFWDDTANVNPLWLSILFSICYMSSLIGEASNSSSNDSSKNDLANRLSLLHTAAGQCLVLGEYHRPQKFTVEALGLYAHCKNITSLDPSREAGAILGMVVRMAYEMGYHRDPDLFGSFTVFEGEMRRRLWASCKQLDLMISFMLGLPSNICLENCDTKSPRNLLDSDFDADTQVLPASRSENEATRLLWFVVKERQMIGFSKVCQDALSFTEKSGEEIVQLDSEIREMHTTIPDVLRARPLAESIIDPPFLIMTRLYIDFIHLKSLCVLHRKYMARGNVFSTVSCVEAGTRLVSEFIDMYKEFARGGQLYAQRWMLGNFTMNDFLLGVMVLCLAVHTRWKRGSAPQNSAIDTATESRVLALLEESHAICVEKSSASRDARRVSHAIRLTLHSAKSSSNVPKNAASQVVTSTSEEVTPFGVQSTVGETQGLDSTSLLLPPWNGFVIQGEETAFGMLDPFNFTGNDVENMDWTLFDPQI